VVKPFAAAEVDGEDDASGGEEDGEKEVVGAEMDVDAGCASVAEVVNGSGDSVLRLDDGPTGIIVFVPSPCPSLPPASPCWLASVELENGEAILTQVYYVLEIS
jgi:hypothetical protein